MPSLGAFLEKDPRLSLFVQAARLFAEQKRRVWSGGLADDIAAIEADGTLPDRVAAATDKVLAAKKLPPLPAITQDEMLVALEKAAMHFGIEPTIELRADLRKVIENKPPPDVAHQGTIEVFTKHKDMQQIRMIGEEMTRH